MPDGDGELCPMKSNILSSSSDTSLVVDDKVFEFKSIGRMEYYK